MKEEEKAGIRTHDLSTFRPKVKDSNLKRFTAAKTTATTATPWFPDLLILEGVKLGSGRACRRFFFFWSRSQKFDAFYFFMTRFGRTHLSCLSLSSTSLSSLSSTSSSSSSSSLRTTGGGGAGSCIDWWLWAQNWKSEREKWWNEKRERSGERERTSENERELCHVIEKDVRKCPF